VLKGTNQLSWPGRRESIYTPWWSEKSNRRIFRTAWLMIVSKLMGLHWRGI
jgi:hypothetical protein